MKTCQILVPSLLAAITISSKLFAAEPNSTEIAAGTTNAPALQQDLADQAALVQQIGAEAARGFDPAAHARALREQIEALIGKAQATSQATEPPKSVPVAMKIAGPGTVSVPVAHATVAEAASTNAVVRDAIQKLRTVLDRLEAQLNAENKHP